MTGNGWVSRALAQPRLSDIRQRWAAARIEQRRRRQIVQELSTYTNRELLELGFYRADLAAIASGTYQR